MRRASADHRRSAGRVKGSKVTARLVKDRLDRELVGNVSLRVLPTERPDTWEVQGRGELALAIQRLAADDELRGRLVSNALAWCEANSWDAVADRHAELYSGLLDGGLPSGFSVPIPSDDPALGDDEDPLDPGHLDLGLAPPLERSND